MNAQNSIQQGSQAPQSSGGPFQMSVSISLDVSAAYLLSESLSHPCEKRIQSKSPNPHVGADSSVNQFIKNNSAGSF